MVYTGGMVNHTKYFIRMLKVRSYSSVDTCYGRCFVEFVSPFLFLDYLDEDQKKKKRN